MLGTVESLVLFDGVEGGKDLFLFEIRHQRI